MNSINADLVNADLVNWLQTTVIFHGLSPARLSQFIQIAQFQTWSRNEIIFNQDTPATGFYVVKTGRVKVFKVSSTGKEQILNIFKAGDNFAEVSALDGHTFPASASALDWVELIFFPRLDFLQLLHADPSITIQMLSSLSKHLRHLVGVIEDLSFKDVPQRLAEYLLQLSEMDAVSASDRLSNTVTLDLTKTQLAAALGTIPATLSRAFYRLSNEGIISVSGSQIIILDRERLQSVSQTVGVGNADLSQ